MKRVSAIVPAYNEAPRITQVLKTLMSYSGFLEVIVVDDGSSDGTAAVAQKFNARVIRNEKNLGKGIAMQKGVEIARGNVLFFCDADIVGLTHDVINDIVKPVLRREQEMFVGARKEKERKFFGFSYSPLLDGQRALTRELWERVPPHFKRGFEIESALNHFAKSFGCALFDITQTKKEEKRGYFMGKLSRFAMYKEIMIAKTLLHV